MSNSRSSPLRRHVHECRVGPKEQLELEVRCPLEPYHCDSLGKHPKQHDSNLDYFRKNVLSTGRLSRTKYHK